MEQVHKKFPLIKKAHAKPVPIVLPSFSIQTACGIVFFSKQLVCASLEKKINAKRFWLPFSEFLDIISSKPMQRLFRLFLCLFQFKQLVFFPPLNIVTENSQQPNQTSNKAKYR